MKKLLRKLIFYFNIFVAILLLIADFATIISPETLIIPSFFALFFVQLFFINIIFVVGYVLYKQWHFSLSLVVIILSFQALDNTFSFQFSQKEEADEIKVMSYNVRLFNIFDWINGLDAATEIAEFIEKEEPDILCMQEFYSYHDGRNFLSEIMDAGNFETYYSANNKSEKKTGNIIFSKYPILMGGSFKSEKSDRTMVYADIIFPQDTLRVYSLHLAPLHLSNRDYDFIDNFSENHGKENIQGIGKIVGKMKSAYLKRINESNSIIEHCSNSKHPVLLCGDFNDVPVSTIYQNFNFLYNDAFSEAGFGLGNSYNRNFLKFRIDYIFCDKEFEILDFSVFRKNYSDHFPVSASIVFSE